MNPSMIELSRIRVDGGTQQRVELSEPLIAEYLEHIAALPPGKVVYDGEHYWLWDGFHTHRAHEEAGTTSMQCEVTAGTQRDAILLSCGANAQHGLQRSNEDKRKAVNVLLDDEEWSRLSDREIGRLCAVSNKLVSVMRQERRDASVTTSTQVVPVTVTGNSEKRTYTTKHGTKAEMNTANIGRKHKPSVAPASAPPLGETEQQAMAACTNDMPAPLVLLPQPAIPIETYKRALDKVHALAAEMRLMDPATAADRERHRKLDQHLAAAAEIITKLALPAKQKQPRNDPLPPITRLKEFWASEWERRYQRPYPFSHAAEGQMIRRLLAACGGSFADAEAAMLRYLREEGAYYHGHPLADLCSVKGLPKFLSNGRGATANGATRDHNLTVKT